MKLGLVRHFTVGMAVLLLLAISTELVCFAQTADPARQLQQIEPVKVWPSKAKRWALVIGVDKYTDPQISALRGADNDARRIADALVRYAGFPQDQVIVLSTAEPSERFPTRVNILRRLSNLSAAVPKDGLLLVFFAGHGMERGGHAFLLPSDAQIGDEISFLEETAISMARVRDRLKETGVSQVLFLLDACRNDPGGRADAPNPLSSAYVNAFNFDVRNHEVQAFATIYATGIGQRAYEYTEKKQGYFSWALVEGLQGAAANDKGEVTLSQLVKYVQETVPKRIAIDLGATKQQKPFAIIEGYRAEDLIVAVAGSGSISAAVPATRVDPVSIELAYWDSIKNSNNPEDFTAYLAKYPDGQFTALAKNRVNNASSSSKTEAGSSKTIETADLAFWDSVKNSTNAEDFNAYLRKYPNGEFAELARVRAATRSADISSKSSSPGGDVGGIGVEFEVRDNRHLIKSVAADSPARRAGLQPGDQILRVNGQEIANLRLEEVAPLIRGPVGSHVTLNILSNGASTARDVVIVRGRSARLAAARYAETATQLASQHSWIEAEAQYREALKLDNDTAWYHGELGFVLFRQNKSAEAEAEYRKALGLDQKVARYHSLLALAIYQRLDANSDAQLYDEAEAEARTAVQLDGKVGWTHDTLGTILVAQKKWSEAEAEYKEALRLDPQNVVIKDHLSKAQKHKRI